MKNRVFKPAFILSASIFLNIQVDAQKSIDFPDQLIPMDSSIIVRKLKNGLTYYLLKDTNASMVYCKLVVRAGYNNENKNQIEIAHFLEHLPFVQTRHFPDPRNYFIKRGLKNGIDMNARTSAKYTDYFIQFPKSSDRLQNDALLFLRDIAGGFLILNENVDKERGGIIGELREGAGVDSKLNDQYFKYIMPLNSNRERTSAAALQSLNTADAKTLSDFYNSWYLPENEMLFVAGDINIKEVEKKIIKLFGDIEQKPNIKTQKIEDSAEFKEGRQVLYAFDKNVTKIQIQLLHKLPFNPVKTFRNLQQSLIRNIYNEVVRTRFANNESMDESGVWGSAFGTSGFIGPSFSIIRTLWTGNPDDDNLFERLKILAIELERIKTLGFTSKEIAAAKENILRNMLAADSRLSPDELSYVLMNHFIEGAAACDRKMKFTYDSLLLAQLPDTLVNKTVMGWLNSKFMDVVITAPGSQLKSLPGKDEIEKWLDSLSLMKLTFAAEIKTEQDDFLFSDTIFFKDVKDYKVSEIKSIGIKKIILDNGITILVKKIPSAEPDRINMQAFAPTGACAYGDSNYLIATRTPSLFTSKQLNNILQKKNIFFLHGVTYNNVGFSSMFPADQLSIVLQLIYKRMEGRQFDTLLLQKVLSRQSLKERTGTDKVTGVRAFFDEVKQSLNINVADEKFLAKKQNINIGDAIAIYRDIFGNTKNFTFAIVGNFDEQAVLPIVVKYLSSLPVKGSRTKLCTVKAVPGFGLNRKIKLEASESKGAVSVIWGGFYNNTFKENLCLNIIQSVLEKSLMQSIRYNLGGTYRVLVNWNNSLIDKDFCYFSINFECSSNRTEELSKVVISEINKLRDIKYLTQIFEAEKKSQIEYLKLKENNPDVWMDYLKDQILLNRDLEEMKDYQRIAESINAKDLQQFIYKHLPANNMSVFQLVAE